MANTGYSVNSLYELSLINTDNFKEGTAFYVVDKFNWYFWDNTTSTWIPAFIGDISSPNVVGKFLTIVTFGDGNEAILQNITEGDLPPAFRQKVDDHQQHIGILYSSINNVETAAGTRIGTVENRVTTLENNSSGGGSSQVDCTELWLKFNGNDGSTDFIEDSNNNYLIVPNGNPIISTTESKFGGSSLYLDGSSYLSSASINFKGDFTVECWIKTSNNGYNAIIGQCLTGLPTNTWIFYADISYYDGNYSSTTPVITSSAIVNDDQWHHIALTRKGRYFYIFVDGILKISQIRNILNPVNSISTLIGYDKGSSYFNGYIDNFRISKKAIYTPNLYPDGFTLPDENFAVTAITPTQLPN
jgi:Concanavalin A-like lectin/glucanases superfamily